MVSMWYFNCTVDPPRFSLLYHIFNQIDRKTTGYGINDRLRTQEIVPASAFSPNNSLTASPVVLEQSARLSRSLSVCFAPRSSSSCRTSLRLRDRATSSQLLMLPVPPRQSGAPVSTAGILYNLASDLWSTASVLPFYPFAAVPRENKSTSFKNSSILWDCFSSVKLPKDDVIRKFVREFCEERPGSWIERKALCNWLAEYGKAYFPTAGINNESTKLGAYIEELLVWKSEEIGGKNRRLGFSGKYLNEARLTELLDSSEKPIPEEDQVVDFDQYITSFSDLIKIQE